MMGSSASKKGKVQDADMQLTIRAAIIIQTWCRRRLARKEAQAQANWKIFQSLEYSGEQDQLKLSKFFNDLIAHFGNTNKMPAAPRYSFRYADFKEDGKESYNGKYFEFPLRFADLLFLIEFFRRKGHNRLPAVAIAVILHNAARLLSEQPNIYHVSMTFSNKVTIVGDIHGNLDDLLVIFHKNGLPSSENPYIFNGDFVDRGNQGLEVLILLLAAFLVYPNAVFLHRGNHEDSVMNARYGFANEMQAKYRTNCFRLLALVDEVYRFLPLGSIVNNQVLVVHGGISNKIDLNVIKNADRSKFVSIVRPPLNAATDKVKAEWKMIFHLLWSDPNNQQGCSENVQRGMGIYFGPDVTENFLKQNKLKMLIRSHECKVHGYELTHKDRVITIFSSSNYYAVGSNTGAYMVLTPRLEMYFVEYVSNASRTKDLTITQRVGLVEGAALQELTARLRSQRKELENEFKKYDPKNTGTIRLDEWCAAMKNTTQMDLPWRHLHQSLVTVAQTEPVRVNYLSTLNLLETEVAIQAQATSTSVVESLYKNRSSLEAIFHILDPDNKGEIPLEDFAKAISVMHKHLPDAMTSKDALEMLNVIDINKDGFIDLNEFLEAFRLSEQSMQQSREKSRALKDSDELPSAVRHGSLQTSQSISVGEVDLNDYETKTAVMKVKKVLNGIKAIKTMKRTSQSK